MTFDQTMLLIFSQICIETNLELEIIKKATKCATMFILHTNDVYLSKHYTQEFHKLYVFTIGTLDLTFDFSTTLFCGFFDNFKFQISFNTYLAKN